MEEQRQRQEDEQRRAIAESDTPAGGTASATAAVGSGVAGAGETNTEEAMLQRALALSTETPVKRLSRFSFLYPVTLTQPTVKGRNIEINSFQEIDEGMPDFANMTEEEQIAFAMQMSMQDQRN